MRENLQRALFFFVIGLPLTTKNIRKYWYIVILWLALMVGCNIYLYTKSEEMNAWMQKELQEIQECHEEH